MSVRSALRLKVVLPVTIFHNREKQVAHTLDASSNSARLAGLCLPIEPGDIIEIQRNASRAKFKVFWVGAPGSLLAGQAGVRALPGSKTIWTPDFPQDEPDVNCDPQHLRSGLPLVRSVHPAATPNEEVPARQEFKGGASIRATGYSHAIYAQIADVSEYGAQLKTPFVLPPNTELFVLFNLNGVVVEVPGLVRASDAMAGMEVGFQKMSAVTQDKLRMALRAGEEAVLNVAPAAVAQESSDRMRLAI
jgi:PilZ domain-containing protein